MGMGSQVKITVVKEQGFFEAAGMSVANKHKDVHNYTWYRYRESRVAKSMTNLFLVRRVIGNV